MIDTIGNNRNKSNSIIGKTAIFFNRVNFESFLPECNIRKMEGIPGLEVIKKCLELVFTHKSWNRTVKEETGKENTFQKDVIYRFLNSVKYNWERLLELVAVQVISFMDILTNKKRVKALIVDDSYFDRSRSKKVELLSSIYDHTDGKYKKGFTLFTLGWSDAFSYIPLFFQLLASKDQNRNYVKSESIEKTDIQIERRENASREKPELLLHMVKKAKKLKVPFRYVLFDSWFAFPAIIATVVNEKKHAITMLKRMKNIHYTYLGNTICLTDIYRKIKRRLTKNNLRVAVKVKIKDEINKKLIDVIIVFARDEKSTKWVALLSTNTEIDADEIVRIYGIRWSIEVFFKMAKSYLKLAKEFIGRSYDMLVAHTTIVFLRYIMLSLAVRENKDDKSIGDLFFASCDEIKNISVLEAFAFLIAHLMTLIAKKLKKEIIQIENMVEAFLNSLPTYYQDYFMPKSCET